MSMLYAAFGAAALLAQVLALRETSALFLGHESSLALALAGWICWSGLGCAKAPRVPLSAALAAFCAAAALTLPLARACVLLLPAGALPGLFSVLAACSALTAPAGFCAGVVCARMMAPGSGEARSFYIFEAAGACAAGLLQSFLLAGRLSAAAVVCSSCLLVLALAVLRLRGEGRRGVLLLAAAGLVVAAVWAGDARSRLWRYRTLNIATEVETPYARVAVAVLGERKVFLEDGFVSADYPDAAAQEELAHLSLLAHPGPRRVLVLGTPGLLAAEELLSHGPERLEYCDLDAARARLALSLLPPGPRDRVQVRTQDPRRLLRASPGVYDVVLQSVPEPVNAAANRLFTEGFFREARAALRPGGLLVFSLPSSETYLAPEEAYLAASVLKTARESFPASTLVPGRRMLVFLSEEPLELTPEVLGRRWERRRLKARALSPGALPILLHPERRAWLERSLQDVRAVRTNRDLFPLAYFHSWRVWLAKFVSPGYLTGLAALVLVLFWALGRLWARRGAWVRRPGRALVFSLGFWGMAVEISLILLAQSAFGNLHRVLGTLFAAFMLGLAGGAALGARVRGGKAFGTLLLCAAVLGSLGLSRLAAALVLAEGGRGLALFLALQGAAGLLVGASFCAALSQGEDDARSLYGADLWGASLGGLLAAALLVPLAGFRWALLCCALPCLPALPMSLFRCRE